MRPDLCTLPALPYVSFILCFTGKQFHHLTAPQGGPEVSSLHIWYFSSLHHTRKWIYVLYRCWVTAKNTRPETLLPSGPQFRTKDATSSGPKGVLHWTREGREHLAVMVRRSISIYGANEQLSHLERKHQRFHPRPVFFRNFWIFQEDDVEPHGEGDIVNFN